MDLTRKIKGQVHNEEMSVKWRIKEIKHSNSFKNLEWCYCRGRRLTVGGGCNGNGSGSEEDYFTVVFKETWACLHAHENGSSITTEYTKRQITLLSVRILSRYTIYGL